MDKMIMDGVMRCINDQLESEVNELEEPQAWFYQSTGRKIEVVEERDGLNPSEYFYSCRIHCTDEELDSGEYNESAGIIEIFVTDTVSQEQLRVIVEQAITYDK